MANNSAVLARSRWILFGTSMVCAIREGRKGQTRRVVKDQASISDIAGGGLEPVVWWPRISGELLPCPYGEPGDRLRVKEATWLWCERRPNGITKTGRPKWHYVPMQAAPIWYVADGHKPGCDIVSPETGNQWGWRYKTARFMPAWASRFTLEITDVGVQRVQDISEEDAKSEGVTLYGHQWIPIGCDVARTYTAKDAFHGLWDSINSMRGHGWDVNDWVWAVSFKRVNTGEAS